MTVIERTRAGAYLAERGIDFKVIPHDTTYTTSAEAQALGIPADEVLKTVLLTAEGGFMMAVVPASRRLDMTLVRRATHSPTVRLAMETEIEATFPEFELGALPPLGGLFGFPIYVDPCVLEHEVVAFAAGSQTRSIVAPTRKILWDTHVFIAPIARSIEDFGW